MIEPIIQYYLDMLGGMPYFTQVYGLTELKENAKGVIMPAFYANGKYTPIKFNRHGLTYIRKRSAVSISTVDSKRACDKLQEFSVQLRVVAITKRGTFPSDDALSADRLAATIIKGLTFDNGPLRIETNAAKITSRASLYTTDSRVVKQDELAGLDTKDFNFDDIAIAVDIDLVVTTFKDCIVDPCAYVPQFCFLLPTKVAIPT